MRTGVSYQQVSTLFHIDFEEGNGDSKLSVIWVHFDVVENLMHWSRYNAALIIQFATRFASENSMCLSWAGLSKRHYDSIEPIENILDNRLRELCIGDSLVSWHVKYVVEYVIPSVDPWSYEWQALRIVWFICLWTLRLSLLAELRDLRRQKWPNPHTN